MRKTASAILTASLIGLALHSCKKEAEVNPVPVQPIDHTTPPPPPTPGPSDYRMPYCGNYQFFATRTTNDCMSPGEITDTLSGVGVISLDPSDESRVWVDFGWSGSSAELTNYGTLIFPYNSYVPLDTTGTYFMMYYHNLLTPCVYDNREVYAARLP